MNLTRYKNELILLGSIVFLVISYSYKHSIEQKAYESTTKSQQEYKDIIKAYNLQTIWANKKVVKRIKQLKMVVPSSKVEWSQKAKKLSAKYRGLNKDELNIVLNKLLNLPVQIKTLNIKRSDQIYSMELQCKW
jgi:hypothetical protein